MQLPLRIAAAIVAIRGGARPSDAEHSYGHHKPEYLSPVPLSEINAALSQAKLIHAGRWCRRAQYCRALRARQLCYVCDLEEVVGGRREL